MTKQTKIHCRWKDRLLTDKLNDTVEIKQIILSFLLIIYSVFCFVCLQPCYQLYYTITQKWSIAMFTLTHTHMHTYIHTQTHTHTYTHTHAHTHMHTHTHTHTNTFTLRR